MFGLKSGGLLFDRHKTPLTRRFVVYYCSAVYTRSMSFSVPPELHPLMPYFLRVDEALMRVPVSRRKAINRSFRIEPIPVPDYAISAFDGEEIFGSPAGLLAHQAAAMRSTNERRVGVVWAGGDWDRERWMP